MGVFNCCKLNGDDRHTLINDYKKSMEENWDIPKSFKNYM